MTTAGHPKETTVTNHPETFISKHQHCTSAECPFTLSHTAEWCGYEQPRRCTCGFCREASRVEDLDRLAKGGEQ